MTPKDSDHQRDPNQLARQLGESLARHRKDRGLSASAVARDAGLSRSYLSYVENGKFGDVGVDKLTRLIAVIGVSADAILQEAGYLPTQPAGLPDPKAYLSTVYGLSSAQIDQATAFLDFLAEREHSPKR